MGVAVDRTDATIRLANGHATLEIATGFGPRVMAYRLHQGANIFANVPGLTLEWRPGRSFRMYGGHRLWLGPEERDRTYVPDDAAVDVTTEDGVVTISAPATAETPFAKAMALRLAEDSTAVEVTHTVLNEGDQEATVAPWAITMLRPEGTMLLPLRGSQTDSLQADRNIVVWPYTRLDDPALEFHDDLIVVRGNRTDPTKVGTHGAAGWGAYVVDDLVFTKAAPNVADAVYTDLGAALQCYAKDSFCELETLGPLTILAPGDRVQHTEHWELRRIDSLPDDSQLARLVDQAGVV